MTTTLDSGATDRSTGSLIAGAPRGITIEVRPPKVRVLPEPGTIAEPFSLSAICAAPTLSGQRTRTRAATTARATAPRRMRR